MHKSFIISEEERKRILGIHENATKSQYLKIISEATTHPKSVEPYKPTDEEIEADINNTSIPPCLARMAKTKGWYKGVDGYTNNDGEEIGFDFWTPSKTSGRGMLMYYSVGNGLWKQTGDTIEENYRVRDFNCNQRPFTTPAQSGEELKAGKKFIYFGDTTPVMSQIKQFLKELGKLTEDADMSEKYDKVTFKAIKEFQKEKGLRVDGIIGPKTYNALFSSQVVDMQSLPVASNILSQQAQLEKEKQEKEQESKMKIKVDDNSGLGGGGSMGQNIGNVIAQALKDSSYEMEEW